MTSSTGEYEFRCKKCKQAISQDLHKTCNSMNNERVYTHSFIEDCLYGHVCIQCNYIQLTKENIKKHLDRDHQQLNPNDENINEITLLKSSSKLYLMDVPDNKFDESLVKAKLNIHEVNNASDQEDYSTMVDDPDSDVDDVDDVKCIDLTLSDED